MGAPDRDEARAPGFGRPSSARPRSERSDPRFRAGGASVRGSPGARARMSISRFMRARHRACPGLPTSGSSPRSAAMSTSSQFSCSRTNWPLPRFATPVERSSALDVSAVLLLPSVPTGSRAPTSCAGNRHGGRAQPCARGYVAANSRLMAAPSEEPKTAARASRIVHHRRTSSMRASRVGARRNAVGHPRCHAYQTGSAGRRKRARSRPAREWHIAQQAPRVRRRAG